LDFTPDAHTALFGIPGHTVGHSLSPAIDNTAYRALGLNALYLAFEVIGFAAVLSWLRALGMQGLSVRIPHAVLERALRKTLDGIGELR